MKASHALYRGFPIYHVSDSSHYRVNGNGQLEPIRIDQQVIDADETLDVTWANTDIDLFDENFNNIGALWQNADLTRPPQGMELQSSAYQHTQVNKTRCPGPDRLIDRIGQQAFDDMDTFVKEQIGLPGGLRALLAEYKGQIVVMRGNWVSDTSLIIHPHHLDKQVEKTPNGLANIWQSLKTSCATMVARVQSYILETIGVRRHLRSQDYANDTTSDSGRHAYAMTSFIRGLHFFFCHDDRTHVHLPVEGMHHLPDGREHSLSFAAQTLTTRDTKRAHAVGLDTTNLQGSMHLVRFDIPIPSFSTTHVSCGPASNPILGCIFTVSDHSYRPTTCPIKFRFANSRSSEIS